MKKSLLIFFITLFVLNLLFELTFGKEQEQSLMRVIVPTLVECCVVTVFWRWFLIAVQRSIDHIISSRVRQTDVISSGSVNYVRKYFLWSYGGAGILYKDSFVFIPHGFNICCQESIFPLQDIQNVSVYKLCGFIHMGLRIQYKSGKSAKFVINKKSLLYTDLLHACQSKIA
jgi:hypothetical protein